MLDLKQQVMDERENASTSEEEAPNLASNNDNQEIMFQTKIYNRLEDNFHLSNKKALFWNMNEYYKSMNKSPWNALPITFHIENGLNDVEYIKFLNFYQRIEFEIQNKTMYKNRVLQDRAMKAKEKERKEKQERINKMKQDGIKRKRRGRRIIRSEVTSSDEESQSLDETESNEDEESEDDEFKIPKNMWIVKPGENTNRGNGIQV